MTILEKIIAEILDTFLWEGQTEETLNSSVRKCLAISDKYAKQEPCDDVVSRQAVNEIVNDIRDYISIEGYLAIIERMKKLPSVMQKSGKWIGVNPMVDTLMCSECGENIISADFKSNYCPNCGARMVESRESEVNK